MNLFRVRLNCIDHYQANPTRYDPQLRNDVRSSQVAKGTKVPVVRIFGSTETGQKVCAHIHGAFPYLYVEYNGNLSPDEVGAYIYKLHLSIDHALAVSYRRNQHEDDAKFVARITLVKGTPFYGFYVGFRFFLKIYLFNPVVMNRLADLLQQGVIMKTTFQPYEAHLQYLLQFMVDYNLYGCDYLDSETTKFRSPVPEYDPVSNSPHLWHSQSVSHENITDDISLPRVSHCSIEVDICVQHIANRKLIQQRLLHHDFVERLHPIPGDLKLVHSMAGLWRDEAKRRQRQMAQNIQGKSHIPRDQLVTMSADPRQSHRQVWIHEAEYKGQAKRLIEEDLVGLDNQKPGFENFTEKVDLSEEIHTTLESVEDLFPHNLLPALGLPSNETPFVDKSTSSIEVDEKKILQEIEARDEDGPGDYNEGGVSGITSAKDGYENNCPRHPVAAQVAANDCETINVPTSSSDLIPGISISIFKTGTLHSTPISQVLLRVAEDRELVGRPPNSSTEKSRRTGSPQHEALTMLPSGSAENFSQPRIHDTLESGSPARRRPGLLTVEDRSVPASASASASNHADLTTINHQNETSDRRRLEKLSYPKSSSSMVEGNHTKAVVFDLDSRTQRGKLDDSMNASLPSATSPSLPTLSVHEEEASRKIQQVLNQAILSPYLTFSRLPPTISQCLAMRDCNQPDVIYQDAYYSREQDVPHRPREYAGREYRLQSNTLLFLPPFKADGLSSTSSGIRPDTLHEQQILEQEQQQQMLQCSWKNWEFIQIPPAYQEVAKWLEADDRSKHLGKKHFGRIAPAAGAWVSQINGPTPKNKHGFKYTQRTTSTSVEHEVQYMSTMSLEIHVNTRGKYVPNPEEDAIQCVFWACKTDEVKRHSQKMSDTIQSGIIVLSSEGNLKRVMQKATGAEVLEEESELDVIVRMVEIVRTYDPDILTGYEVHGSSWGYLVERARFKYDYDLCDGLSRVKSDSHGRFGRESDRWGFNTTSTIRVTGRHMINIWRAMRGELNLLQYTLENVVWHLLHRRVPHYSWRTLTAWYKSGKGGDVGKIVGYYLSRTIMDLEILEANELVSRTSEQARLLGVDFFSVFSRGSQFKVESIMFRIAKPENFVLISPSRKQVGAQNALECLPLVMEPQSAFYSSPLLVLDFQSLYPSVMIAYNYCYSTFLGRVASWRGMSKMGFTEYKRQQGLLALLQDHINIAPNGMMYVKAEIRKSLLAKMLTEILETRVMVKSGMKKDKDDKVLQRLLNNRQLALKLLANVTYGYTSASFSGRMPCSEIADSIVQTGRETLERAIAYIHSVERWGAEVVYGDTDSLFVYLKGRTRDQAFDIGDEMAKAISDTNPRPIKLKFEKVYHPCVLLAKKRYVGYKYESRGQTAPDFDAKGIETVRRDGTPAEQKIEEKALKLLFETADLSQIKEYFQTQCGKIMRGAVSVQDFCFAREVRLGTYSDKGVPPAGALISAKKMLQDARAEPQYGERVPYVVITGAPGARLADRSVSPEDLLANPHWQLDAEYYITKNLIPPLERIFNLVGANVRQWYDEMPKVQKIHQAAGGEAGTKRTTLESYMRSTRCLVCHARFADEGQALCPACRNDTPASLLKLHTRLAAEESSLQDVLRVCRTCSRLSPLEDVLCDSKDCPAFWTRAKQKTGLKGTRTAVEPVMRALVEDQADEAVASAW